MLIDGAAYVVELAAPRAARRPSPAPAASNAAASGRVLNFDPVEISAKAREFAKLKKDLASLPDLRLDRVALARQQLQQGAYRMDPAFLAQKMLEDAGGRASGGESAGADEPGR